MKMKFVFIAILVAFFSASMLNAAELGSPAVIEVAQANKMVVQGTLFLDVREQSEYDEIHAPRSTLIPLDQLGARMNEIAKFKDQPIVVICHSGKRSQVAVKALREAGFPQATSVTGGMVAWEKAGFDVVRK